MDKMDKYELLMKNREYIQYCNRLLYILYENINSMNEFELKMLLNQLKEIHSELSKPTFFSGEVGRKDEK